MRTQMGIPDTGGTSMVNHILPPIMASVDGTSSHLDDEMNALDAGAQVDPILNSPSNNDPPENVHERRREYPIYHKGPYIIFIKQKSSSLSHVSISRKLNENFKNGIKSIMKVNSSKMRVEMSSATNANKALKMPFLAEYRVYIPAESVEIDGIVSIDQELSVKEIIEMDKGKFSHSGIPMASVVHAHRYSRRVEGDNFEPLDTIRVTLSGMAIPKWLWIYGLLIPVRIYNPQLMTCKKCLADHHTEKHCTSKAFCLKCKGNHMTSVCTVETPWCAHCREQIVHGEANECPAYAEKTKKLIQKTLKKSKQSYADAVKSFQVPLIENRYGSLSEDSGDSDDTDAGAIGFWDNFVKPPREIPNVASGSKRTSDTEGKKRPRSPSVGSQDGKKPHNDGPKSKKFIGEIREKRADAGSPRNASVFNIEAKSVKKIIKMLMSHFKVSPAVESLIKAIVLPLIDSLWPSFCSFVSSKSGRRASSRAGRQND